MAHYDSINSSNYFYSLYCFRSPLLTASRLIFLFSYLDDSVH